MLDLRAHAVWASGKAVGDRFVPARPDRQNYSNGGITPPNVKPAGFDDALDESDIAGRAFRRSLGDEVRSQRSRATLAEQILVVAAAAHRTTRRAAALIRARPIIGTSFLTSASPAPPTAARSQEHS